jgi:hypothetical protein
LPWRIRLSFDGSDVGIKDWRDLIEHGRLFGEQGEDNSNWPTIKRGTNLYDFSISNLNHFARPSCHPKGDIPFVKTRWFVCHPMGDKMAAVVKEGAVT